MIYELSKGQIRDVLDVLGLAGEAESKSRYDPYFGPLVMCTAQYQPFITRMDDTEYHCSEISEVSMHDGGAPVWKGEWEECSPYVSRIYHRFCPRKTGSEYRYYRKSFSIPDALYIITERFTVVDRVFLCNNHPDFEWLYVLKGLEEYSLLNRVVNPPKVK